ncbi:MAG: protein translocase subunit SecD [Planctomycetota bacterium]|jgi:SecD/SecF fusion protein
MQNIVWKILLIIVVLGLCLYALNPPSEKVRLGKDLRGGVSLVYSLRIPEGAPAQEVVTQTIEVLKDRVNPTGVFDISFQPLGLDRIEIVMPLPNQEVLALRAAYQVLLDDVLAAAEIPEGRLEEAVRAGQAAAEFGGEPGTERRDLIEALQAAFDALDASILALEEAPDDVEAAARATLEQAVADAEIALDDARAAALGLSLERSRLVRALQLPVERDVIRDLQTGEILIDEATGEPERRPSQRELALDDLEGEFPHLAAPIAELVEAYDTYQSQRSGFDDPEDLKRLLKGAGVLEYRIAVVPDRAEGVNVQDMRGQLREVGPDNVDSSVARWFAVNDLEQWYDEPQQYAALQADPEVYFANSYGLTAAERDGQIYLLLYTTDAKSMTHSGRMQWSIVSTFPTVDQLGRPAVGFRLDSAGGGLMSRLTAPHVGEPMAIVLDGQVYSAPRLQSQIGSSGIITGNFSAAEIGYLTRVLAAGSLEATLSPEPIAVNTLGPSIGADNLTRGLAAFVIALIAVAIFMLCYYFFAGAVADFALLANGLIIFGVMALIQGTFTLPGLAGIVLTIGMAVDANVLIYERIREELFAGELDLRGAIREGYAKALSTIIDANVTNLIVCFVLFKTATAEVKGFALTLTIGICATLFTALFVTRVIYTLYTDLFGFTRLKMLPTVFPAIHRALEPSINWIGLRRIFWSISVVVFVSSLALVWSRGVDLFDTEFRGGVSVTIKTAEQPDGTRARLVQAEVEDRVRSLAAAGGGVVLPDVEASVVDAVRPEFDKAAVLTVGNTAVDEATGQVAADSFQIKIANPRGLGEEAAVTDVVIGLIEAEFGDQLDITPALRFRGAGSDAYADHTFAIVNEQLGANFDRPRVTDRVKDLLGGVGVLIRDIEPPATSDDVLGRIDRMRQQPDFADCIGRTVQVYGIEASDPDRPDAGYREVVVVVYDPDLSYLRVDPEVWETRLAEREWALISAALTQRTSLEQVSTFSSAIAQTLSAQAVVAVVLSLLGILAYIWIRFGSLRYSIAAIVALVHDVTIALGLVALTAIAGRTAIGSALLIEEFRIDLGVVAALLTIIGYSLNDTIVILDRIRENRGKLPLPTAPIVNRSINQTVSRTLLTSVTTLLAVGIMYVEGGTGIRPFTFCLLVGLVVGTYSSVAIAAPLVFKGSGPETTEDKEVTVATTGGAGEP